LTFVLEYESSNKKIRYYFFQSLLMHIRPNAKNS
jgi:hypothetical protein